MIGWELGEVEWKKKGGGWQQRIAAFCDVWLSSGSRRSPLVRRYRLRCELALTFLVMSSLRVQAKRPSKRTVFLFFCSSFLTSFEITNHLREKKREELNQTALSVDEFLACLVLEDAINFGFFPRTLLQTTSQILLEVRSWHVHRICKSHMYIQTDFCV